jgi:hypothetical protein
MAKLSAHELVPSTLGERPQILLLTRTLEEAAAKFVLENLHKTRPRRRYLATQVADAVDRP